MLTLLFMSRTESACVLIALTRNHFMIYLLSIKDNGNNTAQNNGLDTIRQQR
jgi:hypothetical protein